MRPWTTLRYFRFSIVKENFAEKFRFFGALFINDGDPHILVQGLFRTLLMNNLFMLLTQSLYYFIRSTYQKIEEFTISVGLYTGIITHSTPISPRYQLKSYNLKWTVILVVDSANNWVIVNIFTHILSNNTL